MSSSAWRKVTNVGLEEPLDETSNHYDAHDLPADALEVEPGEQVAIFMGLEVLDGSKYKVSSSGQFRILESKEEQQTASKKKRRKKKRKESTADDKDIEDGKPAAKRKLDDLDKQTKKEASKKKKKIKDNKNGSIYNEVKSGSSEEVQTKKKKEKKARKANDASETNDKQLAVATSSTEEQDDEAWKKLQTSWLVATGGVALEQRLSASLAKQEFWTPTPIQSATLPAAMLGRRNIVGAAPTGSGKTLAYLLPILQHLLGEKAKATSLQALILTPTRELALQVSRECDKLVPRYCGAIVGGLAPQKQKRILEERKPPILVATPGRLWELISCREHAHLNDMSQIRFLVIDEADRMIQQGSFPQLVQIFDAVHQANPLDSDDDDEAELGEELDQEERLLGLPGVPGESKVEMLSDDILMRIQQQSEAYPVEVDDSEYKELQLQQENDDSDDDVSLPVASPVPRQTFVYSATLTLPPSASYVAPKKSKRKNKNKASTVEGAIAEILEKAQARGPTKVVDLTSRGASALARSHAPTQSSSRLPPGLSLQKIECTQRHKDSHLYAYLVTTAQGASGPCLVFCNSIAAVRRVGATLQTLRLPVRMLHANMAQKARFKAVESLREPKSRAIVVATDVAARGLDIPTVATVVHYDVARQVDTFIHRAGRTARGMGQGAVGSSLSLIAPGEDKAHDKVCEALNSKHLFETVQMDGRLMAAAQERTNLAAKIVACEQVENKAQKSNKWFQEAAKEAGLDLDDDMLDDGLAGGDHRDQQQLRQAQSARGLLRQLLAEPMKTQRFGKFLSSNSAAAEPDVAAYVVPLTTTSRKKRKRKGKRK